MNLLHGSNHFGPHHSKKHVLVPGTDTEHTACVVEGYRDEKLARKNGGSVHGLKKAYTYVN